MFSDKSSSIFFPFFSSINTKTNKVDVLGLLLKKRIESGPSFSLLSSSYEYVNEPAYYFYSSYFFNIIFC